MGKVDLGSRIRGGLIGLIIGDALGVPAEFKDRRDLDENPIEGMTGNGTYNQLPGTFSDDGSLALSSAESLLEGFSPEGMMRGFHAWFDDARWSARGEVFDYGVCTASAIYRYAQGYDQAKWGARKETDNGNGSLMRMLPVSSFLVGCSLKEIIGTSFEASSITHAHIRSCLCCAYYSLLIDAIASGADFIGAMKQASIALVGRVGDEEARILGDILDASVLERDRVSVKTTGYVVHTLEASLWCLHRNENFQETVLEAVNLGGDSDTTGAVTGGLAGFLYGFEELPVEWIGRLARSEEVLSLAEKFASSVTERVEERAAIA